VLFIASDKAKVGCSGEKRYVIVFLKKEKKTKKKGNVGSIFNIYEAGLLFTEEVKPPHKKGIQNLLGPR